MEIIEENYSGCTISKQWHQGGTVLVYTAKHKITNMELHLFNLAETLRAAKLLELEYIVSRWYNFK